MALYPFVLKHFEILFSSKSLGIISIFHVIHVRVINALFSSVASVILFMLFSVMFLFQLLAL